MPEIKENKLVTYLEIIAIRLYDIKDSHKVAQAFKILSDQSTALRCILYENKNVPGAWYVLLYWPVDSKTPNYSEEASFLSGLLKEIGLVHHVVLAPVA